VNLSLNAALLDRAKAMGVNLSATVEALLTAELERQYWQGWNERNREAVAHYNARISAEGLPLARYRSFLKQR
jgi:antitoxin CcdA